MSKSKDEQGHFSTAYSLRSIEETKNHYANWAASYDQEIGKDKGYRQPQRCAEALVHQDLDKNSKIIDIGCGTGLSGIALQHAGYRYIDGCDLSTEMLEKAKAKQVYKRLFETNLNEPPIDAEDAIYDAATCVGVFSFGHVEPKAIDEILRLLKSNGLLVIGLNDHYYNEGGFPAKLDALVSEGKIEILSRDHGFHLEHVKDSTGWVITSRKI
jgi:predicted TPR repeat methyltransferase